MKLSLRTIAHLKKYILNEVGSDEYEYISQIMNFFEDCLGREGDFDYTSTTIQEYVESKLKQLNGSDSLIKIIEEAFDPTYCRYHLHEYLSGFNEFLIKDGYIAEIVSNKHRKYIKVSPLNSGSIDFTNKPITSEFMNEQIDKCNSKITEGDLDGAITNARSLVEEVLENILKNLGHEIPDHGGKLPALYTHFKKHLNLDPKTLDECFKQVVSGLNSCIIGIAGLSNKISDRHCRKYKPLLYHAQLVVDSAFTICKFLLGVFENKKSKPLS